MNKCILFIHVPKVAGTTLQSILQRLYAPQDRFLVDGGRARESLEQLRSLPESRRAGLRYVGGHMPFGVHTLLPMPCTYVTLLREPIDRLISHYYYAKAHPKHYLHRLLLEKRVPLEEYPALSPEARNGQTRLLCGDSSCDGIFGNKAVGPDHLERAKANLDAWFAAVGTSERFDEFLVLASSRLGWRSLCYMPANVSRKRPSREEISPAIRARLEQANELDLELYAFVQHRFQEAAATMGDSLRVGLDQLHRANRWFRPPARLSRLVRGSLRRIRRVLSDH